MRLRATRSAVAALVIGTVVSFIVAYASIAWLLKFVAHHTMMAFRLVPGDPGYVSSSCC